MKTEKKKYDVLLDEFRFYINPTKINENKSAFNMSKNKIWVTLLLYEKQN